MAIYTPRPYVRERYVENSRLGDLLMQQGRNAADAQRRQGDISAQMWGNVGNVVSNAIGEYAKQKRDEPRLAAEKSAAELGALQLSEKKKAVTEADIFKQIIKDTPQLDEDGVSLYDIPAITKQMAAKGLDPTTVVQHLEPINNAFRTERAAKLAVVQRGAQSIIAGGNDPVLAGHFLDQIEKNGTITKDQAQQYRDFIAADPANVAKITAALAGPRKFERGAPGSVAVDPLTGQAVPGSAIPEKPPPPGTGQHVINGQLVGPDGQPIGAPIPPQVNPTTAAAQAETVRHNAEMERIGRLTAGRAEATAAETRRHNLATEAGVATGREKPSEDERKTAGFYGQMSDSVKIMNELEGQLTKDELYQIQTLPQEGLVGMANRGMLSDAAKRYLQAFEQFTEARLRPVSGAAISDSEFARDRRTYAKQYGETEALAAQRKASRDRALDSLKKRAGRALQDDVTPGQMTAVATVRMRAPNGQEADVPASQVEAAKKKGATVVK